MFKKSIFWFRQDLRTFDNIWLFNAVQKSENILPIFIIDENLQNEFWKEDKRFLFLYELLTDLKRELQEKGSDLYVFQGVPEIIFPELIKEYNIDSVFLNNSYSSYGKNRDLNILNFCNSENIQLFNYNDFLIFPPEKIPYRKVFTPFYKIWRRELDSIELDLLKIEKINTEFSINNNIEIPNKKHPYFTLDTIKKSLSEFNFDTYEDFKDFPAIELGTSKLSPYLRFWKISPRWLFLRTRDYNETFVKEIAWREFWHHIRYNFPEVDYLEFQEKRRNIDWINKKEDFEKFCNAETWYPIIDAAIIQLKETNFMHGRVRMVVASFLTKNLLIDWKMWENFFKKYLLDYDETINIWNWQWSASVWPDPKPLRVFNPILQSQKFDKNSEYVKKYIPELDRFSPQEIHDPIKYSLDWYFPPMIDQKSSWKRARIYYKWENRE